MTPAERGDFLLERLTRELRLFEKYGITDLSGLDFHGPYRKLALALAERYEDDFKPRGRGRPKGNRYDCDLVLMVELLRRRDHLSIPRACEMIAEKGALPGRPKSLYQRHKSLMKQPQREEDDLDLPDGTAKKVKVRHPWRVLLQRLEQLAGARYVEILEETVGAKLK